MKILIMGQPRSGKTTMAKQLHKVLDIPIIHLDKLRYDWGYHEPWKGYSTEINPDKQREFYDKLKEEISLYNDIIVEGSSINPKDRNYFNFDIYILLGRKELTVEDEFDLSRKYDKDWTSRREDNYLIKLFAEYKKYAEVWRKENPDIYYDTSNYENIHLIIQQILEKLKKTT